MLKDGRILIHHASIITYIEIRQYRYQLHPCLKVYQNIEAEVCFLIS